MAKRGRIDIIEDMLAAIQKKGGSIKPTHLMYKSNLSHGQMGKYLEELTEKMFVQRVADGEKEQIEITEQGCRFLQKIREMKEFEDAFGL